MVDCESRNEGVGMLCGVVCSTGFVNPEGVKKSLGGMAGGGVDGFGLWTGLLKRRDGE